MQILYDHQVFSWQVTGGISRYFTELISHLNGTYSSLISNNLYLSSAKNKPATLLPDIYVPGKTQLITIINKIKTIMMLKNGQFDIFHPTYYDPYFLPYIGDKPFVVTVFDMIHELYPTEFPGDTTTSLKKKVLSRATQIIAISSNTKKDLVNIFGIKPEKIEVIYLGSSLDPKNYSKVNLPSKYLLYVGDRGKYKNFTSLVGALHELKGMLEDVHLVCVGGGKFNDSEKKLLGSLMSRSHQLSLTDPELTYAYKHALSFIMPSLYEGFCLPVLEAMICSCPVVCSNTSSIPEVAGDAAIYFDPKKESSIASAIKILLKDEDLRSKSIKQGLAQATKFSWDKCAKETEIIYQKAITQ